MNFSRLRWGVFAAIVSLAAALSFAADEPNFTEEQKINFLLNAKVISSKHTSKGITSPWRLTLNDGTLTHDAVFQTVHENKPVMQFSTGRTEINFKDYWEYDIAGYRVAKMLGLDDMIPIYLERKWNGERGAIGWWVPAIKMDEEQRRKQDAHPADIDAWNKQMYKVRVFTQLTYDTDPNLTNVLIDENWKIWRIDFTRAFRLFNDLPDPKDLVMCDRQLLAKLKALNYDEVLEKTKPYLNKGEVKALIARRDKIVAFFEKLVAQKGEGEVLY